MAFFNGFKISYSKDNPVRRDIRCLLALFRSILSFGDAGAIRRHEDLSDRCCPRSVGAISIRRSSTHAAVPEVSFNECRYLGTTTSPAECSTDSDIVLVLSIARTCAAARLCLFVRKPPLRVNPAGCDRGTETGM